MKAIFFNSYFSNNQGVQVNKINKKSVVVTNIMKINNEIITVGESYKLNLIDNKYIRTLGNEILNLDDSIEI